MYLRNCKACMKKCSRFIKKNVLHGPAAAAGGIVVAGGGGGADGGGAVAEGGRRAVSRGRLAAGRHGPHHDYAKQRPHGSAGTGSRQSGRGPGHEQRSIRPG